MNWTNNVQIFDLAKANNWNDISSFENNQGKNMFITVTDDTMYDRYHQNDTVNIKISNDPPDNSDCLILLDNEVLFRHLVKNDDGTYQVIQTWPERILDIKQDQITFLGYASGILRV